MHPKGISALFHKQIAEIAVIAVISMLVPAIMAITAMPAMKGQAFGWPARRRR
jgi:hypothetical protein